MPLFDAAVKRVAVLRLRRIKGLQRMLLDDRDCTELAQQISAVRAALDRVAVDLISEGLEHGLREELAGKPNGRRTLLQLQRTSLMLR